MNAEDIHVEVKGYFKQFLIEKWNWSQSYGFFIRTFSKMGNEIRLYRVNKTSISRSADIKTIELIDVLKKSGNKWYIYSVDESNFRDVFDSNGKWITQQKKVNGKWIDY